MRALKRKTGLTLTLLFMAVLFVPLTAISAQAGGGCHGPATEGTNSVVTIVNACFDTTITRVPVGTRVTWVNKDPMSHVVVGQGFTWATEQELQQGDRFSTVFRAAGVFPYTCYLHPGMNGAVVVGGVDAPKADPISGAPVSDSISTRDAPAPKGAAKTLTVQRTGDRTSAGAWPAATAIGFALAFALGMGMILQWKRGRELPEAER
jgi:plastocyanin